MFRLELTYQDLTVREYRLQDGDIRFIGRAPENHIVIDDPGVSRHHCFIIQMGDDLLLGDRGSKHMTLVNGMEVLCAKLYHGDTIRVGVHHTLKISILTKDSRVAASAVSEQQKKLMTTT